MSVSSSFTSAWITGGNGSRSAFLTTPSNSAAARQFLTTQALSVCRRLGPTHSSASARRVDSSIERVSARRSVSSRRWLTGYVANRFLFPAASLPAASAWNNIRSTLGSAPQVMSSAMICVCVDRLASVMHNVDVIQAAVSGEIGTIRHRVGSSGMTVIHRSLMRSRRVLFASAPSSSNLHPKTQHRLKPCSQRLTRLNPTRIQIDDGHGSNGSTNLGGSRVSTLPPHAEFDRSRSNGKSVVKEMRLKKWPIASRLSRSLKFVGTDTNRVATYDFLLKSIATMGLQCPR